MEDDGGSQSTRLRAWAGRLLGALAVGACVAVIAAAEESGASAGATSAFAFPWLRGAVVLGLMLLASLFAASETAYVVPRKLRLDEMEKSGGLTGRVAARLAKEYGPLLTVILVGHITVLVLYGILATRLVADIGDDAFGWPGAAALAAGIVVSTVLLVFCCESIPRLVVNSHRETAARALALPLQAVLWTLRPVAALLILGTDLLLRVFRVRNVRAVPFLTDEELKTAVTAQEVRGVIEEQEGQMIQGILSFDDVMLREILVPRPDIVALPETATVREALDLYREEGYSRMPVYVEDLDHVTGLLVAKDLLPCVMKDEWERPVSELMRTPRFVPETMTVLPFIRDAQRVQIHMAIVVDEYGGTAGLVTLEDAIEQVVGEIPDQAEHEKPAIVPVGERTFRVDGGVPLSELGTLLGAPIANGEHETVAGLVMDLTNKIPERGDESVYNGVRFVVEEVEGKRATSLTVEMIEPPQAAQGQAG